MQASLKERMLARARTVRDEMQFVSAYPRFDLGGKRAIVQPGGRVVVRLLPRWDIAQKFTVKNGQTTLNPKYVEDFNYYEAREHWYTRQKDGSRLPAWCLKTFDAHAACPLCEAAEAYAATGDDADLQSSRDLSATPLFLYNAVVGPRGKRLCGDDGLVKIGVLPLRSPMYVQLVEIITGGGEEGFSCDDVSDPKTGYDLMLTRPAKDSGDRWKMDHAKTPSTLYSNEDAADKASFANWVSRLIDIPTVLAAERKSYQQLYQGIYGEEADMATVAPAGAAAEFDDSAFDQSAAPDELTVADELNADAPTESESESESTDDPFGGFDQPDAASAAVAAPAQSSAGPRKPPPAAAKAAGKPAQRGRR
jgi:hypothetical protein